MKKSIFFIVLIICSIKFVSASALTLDDFINSALKNNYDLRISRQLVLKAKGQKNESWGGFFPSLTLSYSSNYINRSQEMTVSFPVVTGSGQIAYEEASIELGQKDSYKGQLMLNVPVYTFGSLRNSYLISRYAYEIENEKNEGMKLQTVAGVRKAFYRVLLMRELLNIAAHQKALMEENLRITKRLYESGKASNLDVSRVKVHLARAESGVIEAESNLKLARENLFYVSGVKESGVQIEGRLQKIEFNYDLEELIEAALANRHEISMAQNSVLIQEKRKNLERSKNLPKIYAFGGYVYERPYLNEDEWGKYWMAGASVEFPLLDGLSMFGRNAKNRAAVEEAQIRQEKIKEAVKLQVKNSYYSLKQAEKKIKVQEENLISARENLTVSNQRYIKGLLSNLELHQSILDYTAARMELANSVYNFLSSLEDLKIAAGKELN